MNIETRQGSLIEISANDGYLLDMGDGTYEVYVCVPSTYNINTIKEISISELEEKKIIQELKESKLNEIIKYDTSNKVNLFYVNDMPLWIPRETRVSLQNSTEILLKNNINNVTLWEGVLKFELPCEMLLQMLDDLEIYALKCFNVTAEHKAYIINATTRSEIENYDFTLGYPDKLHFNVNK